MKTIDRIVCLLLSAATAFGTAACEGTDPTVPLTEHTIAADHGFDVPRLFAALDVAAATGTVSSLVVERHGVVVAEGHFLDVPHWGVHETWSITATITSLLAGVAVDRGYLEDLDVRLASLLPRWSGHFDGEKPDITIRHLLTMTSGVGRPSGGPDGFFTWMAQEDQVAWILDHPLLASPGNRYRFDDGAGHLLAAALRQASGTTLRELAADALFGPMGIPFVDWSSDPDGVNYGAFGLRMRSRDLVKVGRLVLNDGRWNGRRLVSREWVQEAVTAKVHPYPDSPEWGFGYLWKISSCRGHPCVYQNGYGGQILVAFPTLDMVVALTSNFSEDAEAADAGHNAAWSVILDQILPSVH
ncbi:MAG: serine hydrolase [Gemmatimonadota bacterium]